MTKFTIKRLLWACAIAAIYISPIVKAEATSFEKIVAERKAEREAERAAAANQPVLTQLEVDRLAIAIPLLQNTLEQLDMPEPSKEQSKMMSKAAISGTPTGTMAKILEGTAALEMLDQQAKESGYQNFSHYAGHFDVAFGVLNSEQWILMARNMVRDGEDKPEPIDSLWDFIGDDSKPAAERQKLSTQLDEMLPRFGTNRKNAEVIFRNRSVLKPLVTPARKK